jgi:hypothetical protein
VHGRQVLVLTGAVLAPLVHLFDRQRNPEYHEIFEWTTRLTLMRVLYSFRVQSQVLGQGPPVRLL